MKPELNLPWTPVCKEFKELLLINAGGGETLTHIGRQATQNYINAATILSIGKEPPVFSQAQRIYAEDFIKDYLESRNVMPVGQLEVKCELVEIALMRSLNLTAEQQENLEIYARSSFELDELRELLELIRGATRDGLQPYIITP